jgi:hypothetical protein
VRLDRVKQAAVDEEKRIALEEANEIARRTLETDRLKQAEIEAADEASKAIHSQETPAYIAVSEAEPTREMQPPLMSLRAKALRQLNAIEQAYHDGFMRGYSYPESLINPESEAHSLATQYSSNKAAA